MYNVVRGDSVVSAEYLKEICKAARQKTNEEDYHTTLELLITKASGSEVGASDQGEMVAIWWKKFGIGCYCEESGEFPAGNFLRQALHSNFRLFINIIGGINRLAVDLELEDPQDSLTLLEYSDKKRLEFENRHNNNRKRFQKDEEWKNFIFFYMLLSEFKITYQGY